MNNREKELLETIEEKNDEINRLMSTINALRAEEHYYKLRVEEQQKEITQLILDKKDLLKEYVETLTKMKSIIKEAKTNE